MFRLAAAVLALLPLAGVASAQPGQPGRSLPLSPGVMPGSPIGPGMPFATQPRFVAPARGFAGGALGFRGRHAGFGPFGSPFFSPGFYNFPLGFGGFYPGFYYPEVEYVPVPVPVPVGPPARPEPTVTLANEFPATLTVQLPAAGEVWLDGKKVAGAAAEEVVLASPVLKPGERFAFVVKARWSSGGKTYETKRTVTLNAGDRSRLGIVSGDEVRE